MSLLDAVTIDLEPTATYARREVTFYPGDVAGEGTLVIRLWKGKRAGSKCECDRYQIQECEPSQLGGRSFLVLNESDPDQPDVYQTDIGVVPRCTCKAGLCKTPSCKHIDSLQALIEEGEL